MSSESSCKEEIEDTSVSHTQRRRCRAGINVDREQPQGGRGRHIEFLACSLGRPLGEIVFFIAHYEYYQCQRCLQAMVCSGASPMGRRFNGGSAVVFYDDRLHRLHHPSHLQPEPPSMAPRQLPIIPRNYCSIAASGGLVCLINNCQSSNHLFVCNPITTIQRRLPLGPPLDSSACALAMSADRQTNSYIVAVVNYRVARSKVGNEVSIHMYESKTQKWFVALTQPKDVCECRHLCTISGGILYCMFFAISHRTYYLLAHDLKARPPPTSFAWVAVPTLPRLSNPSLINLREKLVMVGLIFKEKLHSFSVKALAIWELDEKAKAWREVAYRPWETIEENLGREGSSFTCSGSGDLIYMQSYNSPAVLTFDMARRHWKWLEDYPIVKGNKHRESFVGCSLEPNLKMKC